MFHSMENVIQENNVEKGRKDSECHWGSSLRWDSERRPSWGIQNMKWAKMLLWID